jgi:hypothetical protein
VTVAQGCTDVALRLPNGVCILDKTQAQIYLEALKTNAETGKIEAEKKISEENNAQRAHEIEVEKNISEENKAQRAHELAKLNIQNTHEIAKMEKKMDKQWDLKHRDPPAGSRATAAAAKRKKIKSNVGVRPVAINKQSKKKRHATDEKREEYNRKRREQTAQRKRDKATARWEL